MIIANNRDILNAYQLYVQDGTKLTLASDFIHILRLESKGLRTSEGNETEEESSHDSHKIKRSLSIKIPARNIQKVP
jgi:hypothetical protein